MLLSSECLSPIWLFNVNFLLALYGQTGQLNVGSLPHSNLRWL